MFEINSIDPLVYRVYDHSRWNDVGYQWRKVFVVDDFYKNPDEIRDYALSCDLKTDKKYYTGEELGKIIFFMTKYNLFEKLADLFIDIENGFSDMFQIPFHL